MTLQMRDQENMEKGIEQGLKKGILGTVSVLRGMNVPDETILLKIQQEFALSEEEVNLYMKGQKENDNINA